MSNYSKFLDDLNDFYKDRKAKGLTKSIHPDEALAVVRDNWIQQGKLTELISFIHTNWDSGNCDDFIAPLEILFLDTNQTEAFKLLWTKIIKYRLTALWTSLDDLKRQTKKIDLKEITSIDTSNFNMFSRDSYKDLKRVLAFRRQFAIDGLTKMKNGLEKLRQTDDTIKIQLLIDDIISLKHSSLKL
jgi:hypothetical protein